MCDGVSVMVNNKTLLLIACLVWSAAGINILRIGIIEYPDGYGEQKQLFIKFFDVKSFIIMAVMMTGGILLRSLKLAPAVFIAVFYTGL